MKNITRTMTKDYGRPIFIQMEVTNVRRRDDGLFQITAESSSGNYTLKYMTKTNIPTIGTKFKVKLEW